MYPASAEDVAAAILFSHANSLDLAVCCGGHATGGSSSTEGGLCINLAKMRAVTVDPENKTITAQGGALWSDVDAAGHEHGLATVGGTVNHTGIGGLTLGGGYGWLTNAYGLTIDNLLEVEFVLADGTIVTASETNNPDLFWAARGAGACFGVATSFTYKAYDQKNPVWAGTLVFPPTAIAGVVEFANQQIEMTTGKDTVVIGFGAPPPAFQPCVMTAVFYNGPENEAKELFQPLFELGPLAEMTSTMPYPALNTMFNPMTQHGGRKSMKGASFIYPLDPTFVQSVFEEFSAFLQKVPEAGASLLIFESFKVHEVMRVEPTATAFANRGNYCNVMIGPMWQTEEADAVCRGWARDLAQKFKAEAAKAKTQGVDKSTMEAVGQYANYDGSSPLIRILSICFNVLTILVTGQNANEVFGVNAERLVSLKKRYDPQNIFKKWVDLLPVLQ